MRVRDIHPPKFCKTKLGRANAKRLKRKMLPLPAGRQARQAARNVGRLTLAPHNAGLTDSINEIIFDFNHMNASFPKHNFVCLFIKPITASRSGVRSCLS